MNDLQSVFRTFPTSNSIVLTAIILFNSYSPASHALNNDALNNRMSAAINYLLLSDTTCQINNCQSQTPMSCDEPIWQEADFSTVYHVGPGQEYMTPNDVPWESLTPDTLIKIHWRNEPYRNKWVINAAGSESSPIVVLGVPANGLLPVLSGENATTRQALNYWNEERSLIKIGASSIPDNNNAAYITIACLDLMSAKPGYTFTTDNGSSSSYSSNAAAIHIEQGEHINIKNCDIHDAGNGIFSTANSSEIVISTNHIWDNGIDGSIYQHNSYTESLGIIFEFNYYGPLCSGCLGNNLKDRSAGTIIRYNWIEDGNRQLDLVDSDHSELINDERYHSTFVYGNLLIEHEGQGNRQIVHYGGDSGNTINYRKGTLYFYHNTIYSDRLKNTLLRLSTNDESADLHNNIIAASDLGIVDQSGIVNMKNNWLNIGWLDSHSSLSGSVTASGSIEGTTPGFVNIGNLFTTSNDFHLTAASACIGSADTEPQSYPVQWQFLVPQSGVQRSSLNDLGAYNY